MELTLSTGRLIYIVPSEVKVVTEIEIEISSDMSGFKRREWGSLITTKTDLSYQVRERYSAVVTNLRKLTKSATN